MKKIKAKVEELISALNDAINDAISKYSEDSLSTEKLLEIKTKKREDPDKWYIKFYNGNQQTFSKYNVKYGLDSANN